MTLADLLKKKKEQRDAFYKTLVDSDDKAMRDAAKANMEALDTEIAALESEINAQAQRGEGQETGQGAATVPGQAGQPIVRDAMTGQPFNIINSFGVGAGSQRSQEPEDPFATHEYRKAFMRYCQTGAETPALMPEKRDDAVTTTVEGAKTIPTNIVNEVIKELKERGEIYKRVRKTSIQGGVQIPISSLKPTATWIGEDAGSDRQKMDTSASVTFAYYGLECKIATSLIQSIVSLPIFEQTVRDVILEAMMEGLDKAIVSGNGTGKPLGILNDSRVLVGQKVSITTENAALWKEWKKVFAKIPLSYRKNGIIMMAAATWDIYIDGMVDTNGQPIGRVNYGMDGMQTLRFAGYEVLQVEPDVIKDFDTASSDDPIMIYFKPSDYVVNSNMGLLMQRYYDNDKNQWVDKAILICDGKLADAAGVLIIKKGDPGTLAELDVTSAAGTETINDSVITVDPATAGSGNKYIYKVATTYASFSYNDVLTTGWTDLPAGGLISVASGTKITVAEVTEADSKARARGIAVIVKKTE